MTAARRVLELLGPSTGGIRRHVAYLSEQLRASGWEVGIAGPDGVLPDLDHVVPVPSGADPIDTARSRRALRQILDDYDLVHAHGLKAGWVAAISGRTPPLVVSVHNLVLDEVSGRAAPALRRLEGWLPSRAAATIAVSREVARRFDGLAGADRITVVPPAGPPPEPTRDPATVRAELGVAADADLVVTAARLHPQKGIDTLLDAAAIVVERRPALRWFVFGDGPDRTTLERQIADRGLAGVVDLAGARPNVDSELAAADVVVVTSRWESGPLVVLEALSLGRPVVSTRVGLAGDAIDAGNGRLVDVGDAPALAEAVAEVLRDPPEPPTGMSGSSARFRPAALAADVESVYREVLSQR